MYQALRILSLAIPIVLIAFFAYDMLDDGDEVCYVAYHSGDGFELVEDDTVLDCMFELDDFEFAGWNTEPDGSGRSYMPGDHLGSGWSVTELYAQWVPADGDDPGRDADSQRYQLYALPHVAGK